MLAPNPDDREWLATNGIGGFACGTLSFANTRRYHGLLVAALRPPVERFVMLSKLEDVVTTPSGSFPLSCNHYGDVVHPDGFRHLQAMDAEPIPTWTFEMPGAVIEKSIVMVPGRNATLVRYQVRSGRALRLSLTPLLAPRDYHALAHENGAIRRDAGPAPGGIAYRAYDALPVLVLQIAGAPFSWTARPDWYRSFTYGVERERGLDFVEDLFTPGSFDIDLGSGSATIAASLGGIEAPDRVFDGERARHDADAADRSIDARLRRAARTFVVRRADGSPTVIAGYPWFTDWGRDTCISIPGLLLVDARHDEARAVLEGFARHLDGGLVPNRFGDGGGADYNTVDATLWFLHAAHETLAADPDDAWERGVLLPATREILTRHFEGTRFGIKADGDGLLGCGEPGVQLTWMDAKVGDHVITPRDGKPIEIQALWIAALEASVPLLARHGDDALASGCARAATTARRSFRRFWRPDAGCFGDRLDREGALDAALRPNQLYALALPLDPPLCSRDEGRSAIAAIRRELLTPFGLRTLPPSDPAYRGRFTGPPESRDAAYHQGTVWPFLLEPMVAASLLWEGSGRIDRKAWRQFLDPILDHFANDACLGSCSEVFDGDPPHRAGGCFAQAWSVAALRRILVALTEDGR
ncbi:MAG: amylo-alpha-1,6-glucosidase [Acidobacteriota bacterium]